MKYVYIVFDFMLIGILFELFKDEESEFVFNICLVFYIILSREFLWEYVFNLVMNWINELIVVSFGGLIESYKMCYEFNDFNNVDMNCLESG